MKRAIFLAIVAAVLLVPWAVGYAYDRVNAGNIDMTIVPADQATKPNMHIFGNAVGSISAGDLFYIDASGTAENTTFNLTLSNLDELIHSYRFLTMDVGIYVQTSNNTWAKIAEIDGGEIPAILITMQNGSVSFMLPGYAKYKVIVEDGCYRTFSFAYGNSAAVPQLCLTTS